MTVVEAVFVAIAAAAVLSSGNAITDNNPDVELKTPDLVARYGYPIEVHTVITDDGYILEMHRIFHGQTKHGVGISQRYPILLQHGLAGSSADWVLMGPGQSLAYILADEGYDVWLGNNRGNIYSRNHTTISADDRAFWDFSWHELGVFDLPAMIDYMIGRTLQEELFYIGHSQGTTQFWVMTSERPEYNSKIIRLMVALAPAAYTGNLRGPVRKLTTLTHFGVWFGESFGYPEYTPRSEWGKFVSKLFCRYAASTQFLCSNIIFLIAGYSPDELNVKNLPVIIGHVPAGASWKQLIHYGQGALSSGSFRHFDYYDERKNTAMYNSTIPPQYHLERITVPVALFRSESDLLATPRDVEILEERLRNVVLSYAIPTNTFNHFDFLWGIQAPDLVYGQLLRLLQVYS